MRTRGASHRLAVRSRAVTDGTENRDQTLQLQPLRSDAARPPYETPAARATAARPHFDSCLGRTLIDALKHRRHNTRTRAGAAAAASGNSELSKKGGLARTALTPKG